MSTAVALTLEVSLVSGTGLRIPMDSKASLMWDLDAQIDYRIDTDCSWTWYPFIGSSLVMSPDDGRRLPLTAEGQDFFNFGATDAQGRAMVLGAVGLKVRPVSNIDIGVAYQFPYDNTKGSHYL